MTILGCKCGVSAANTEYDGDGPFFCLYCGEELKPDKLSEYGK